MSVSGGLLSSSGDGPADWIATGHALARALLVLTARGFFNPNTTSDNIERLFSDADASFDGGAGSYDNLFAGIGDDCPEAEQALPVDTFPINITVRRRPRPN